MEVSRGAEGQRGRGAEGQRGRGAEGQRGRGAEGQRGRGAEEKELGICLSSAPLLPCTSADLHKRNFGESELLATHL
ncbi:hypothetical protein COO91_01145 [Nostoc flagelliforme CCNUN1]|uniref:Uncharacterized protein n=1 Tax=Nostoc flagelliforme CCNUN1 TaxID=2038116 RepID=A0A2K8SIJ7_9NOSO|nr:hypothetical protein COO91_01145 [Nostoc flagelliforme CCNUN1]